MTPFALFSTAGNDTLFVERPGQISRAMALVACEQAAYADVVNSVMVMAGDEFCVNACLAFAALQAMRGHEVCAVQICGMSVPLRIRGAAPLWGAEADFPLGGSAPQSIGDIKVFELPGIVHALVRKDGFPDDPLGEAEKLRNSLGINAAPAAGIVWWHPVGTSFEICPVVQVPAAGTCNREQACGSGSLALALLLGTGSYDIAQPSGDVLTVSHRGEYLTLAGTVRLLARGELWPG